MADFKYRVKVGGAEYEVTAPDENTAWQWANMTHAQRTAPAAAAPTAAPEEQGFFSAMGRAAESLVPLSRKGLAAIVEDYPAVVSSVASGLIPGGGAMLRDLGAAASKSETYKELTGDLVAGERKAAEEQLAALGPRKYKGFFEEEGVGRRLGSLAETVALSALPVGAGVATGLITRNPVAAAAVMGAGTTPMTYGGIRERQAVEGIDDVNRAVIGTAVSSALDLVTGIGGRVLSGTAAAAAKELLEAGLKQAAVRVAKSGAEEAGTETLQNVIEQVAGGADPTTKQAILETLEAGLAGALGGTVFSGASEIATAPFRKQAAPGQGTPSVAPEVQAEFQKLAAQQVAATMAANPDISQDEATNMVVARADVILEQARANVEAAQAQTEAGAGLDGGAGQPDVDVAGAAGAGVPPTGAPTPTGEDTQTVPQAKPVRVAGTGEPIGGTTGAEAGTDGALTGEYNPDLIPAYLAETSKAKMDYVKPVVMDIFARVSGLDISNLKALPEPAVKALNISIQQVHNATKGKQPKAIDPEAVVREQLAAFNIPLPKAVVAGETPGTFRTTVNLNGEERSIEGVVPRPAPTMGAPSVTETPTPTPTQTVEDEEDILAPARGEMKMAERKNTVRPLVSLFADDAIDGVKIPTGFGSADLDAIKKQATNQVANKLAKGQDVDAATVVDTLLRSRGFAIPERATPAPTQVAPAETAAPKLSPVEQAAVDLVSAVDAGGVPFNTPKINAIAEGLGLEVSKTAKPEDTIQRIRDAVGRFAYTPPAAEAQPTPTVAETAAPTQAAPEPEYTPQQIAENLIVFSGPEAKSRGYEPNTVPYGMFTEGARDVARGAEPIPDQQILEELGQEVLDAYKAGLQWAQDSVAKAKAPATKVAPVSPAKKAKQVKAAIRRKPGKTVAEKVLNMAQAEVDAMPKEDMVGQVTPYTPEYETIRAKPGINATRMAKMLGPQLYGDPTNMGQVCIKEVLQNSFDATRTAINDGQITQGEISITISKDGRTLTVKDNGIGMTPELLGGKFLEIAGTAKEGDKNAGGFGIAKMLFLYANKNIRVSTARDGRIAEMDVTGEQLFAALDDPNEAPNIEIRELEPVDQLAFPDGHGTIIQLTIPEESGDYKIRQLPRYIDEIASLGLSPLFANIKVTLDGNTARGVRTVDVGANFPAQDYTQFVGVKFPWGVAKVYVTREQTGQQYGRNMHILSNGLWQFSTDVNKDPSNIYSDSVPYRFYVDIVPSVKPDEPGYPFNFNRQNFTDDAKKDFGKIKKYIDAIYAYKSRAGEATSFGNIQYFDARGNFGPVIDLTPSIPVQDTSFTRVTVGDQITVDENGALLVNGQPMPELTPDELKAGIPSASELKVDPDLIDTNSVMVHDNTDVVINATGEKLSIPDYMRRQFGVRFDEFMLYNGATFLTLRNEVARVMGYKGLLDEAIGVSFDPEYRGVSIRLPFSGSFINPLVPVYGDGLRAGYGIFGTMIHELAHHRVRNHNEEFPKEMQNILLNMEADEGFAYQQFKDKFANTITNKYGDIVKLGVELFNGKNPDISVEYRGNRFTDGSPEQASEGAGDGGAGDVRGPRGEGSTGESLLGPAYDRRGGTGGGSKRGAGAKGSAQPVNNSTVNKVAAAKLTKAQIKRLEEAAGIRRMKITGMQKRILRSRSAEETTSLMGKLMLIARNPSEDGNILISLFNSVSGPSALQKLLGPQMTEDVVRLANAFGLKNVQRIDDLMRNEYIPYVNRMVLSASQTSEKLADFLSRTELGAKALTDVVIYANMVDVDPSLAPNASEYMKTDSKLQELNSELASETDPVKQDALRKEIKVRQGEIRRAYTGGVDEQTEETVYGWNDLSRPEFGGGAGKLMFIMLRDEYRKTFDEHYRLLMARINAADIKSKDRIKLKSAVEKMFAEAKKRTIYFPLKRFGEYWVTVGKGKTGEFHMFESLTAQEAFMAQLRESKDIRNYSSGFGRDTLRKELTKNDASAALKNILDLIADGKAADVDVLEESVLQLYLTALPESDMRRRFIHRSFKTGFSTDLLRTYASTSIASANQLGRLAFNYKFDNLITAGLKETEGRPSKAKLDTITRDMALRVKGMLSPNPQNDVDWWLSLGSKATFYLLLSAPKTAFVNLLQLPIVGLATLSAEFGEAATTATMARYMGTFLTGERIGNPFKDKDGNLKLQTPKFTLENSPYIRELRKTDPTRYGELMKAWRFFEERDVTQSTFTASSNIYERSNKPSDKFSFMQSLRRGDTASAAQLAVANTGQLLGASFHTMERIGREIMVMSAFDMAYERAIKQGKTPKDAGKEARELAEKLTNKAMFDFSNWNKSRYSKSRVGRLPLQMGSYRQFMTSLLLRSFVGMIPLQRNKGGKLAAARMFFGVAAMATLFGGLRASWLYGWALGAYGVYEFVKEFFGDDDDEEEKEIEGGYVSEETIQREMLKFADGKGRELSKKDMEYHIRSVWIPETFGPGGTVPKALGLSDEAAAKLAAMADMGLPALGGVDISSSVSLNDLWHSPPSKSDDPEVMFLETLGRTVLGPSAVLATAPIRAVKEANAGNFDKAFEALMPAFLKNPVKAMRLSEEGLVVGKNRDIVLKDPSFYDVYTLAMQSAGFAEAKTSRDMQLDIKGVELEEEVGKQATELLDQRYRAVLEFNKKPTDENLKNWKRVERDITVYNLNYPSNIITEEDKDKSFQSKSKVAGERAYGLGFNPKIPVRQPLAEQRANEMLKDK